jgi:hypothetical protein
MCVLFCCLRTADRKKTELHSRRWHSDSRTTEDCDGCPDHVWTWIQTCKYFLKIFWSLLLYAANLKFISCQSRPQSSFWCRDIFLLTVLRRLIFGPLGYVSYSVQFGRILGLEHDPTSLRLSSHTYKT